MKNFTILFLLIISLFITGCGRVFFYTRECPNDNFVTINNKSKVYIRKGYVNDKNIKTTDSTDGKKDNILIEIQYLIINPNNDVIYISTTPSRYVYDKTDRYLVHSAKNEYPNSFYLNTFSFGKLQNSDDNDTMTIEFRNHKKAFEWKFNKVNKDSYILNSVDAFRFRNVYIKGKKSREKIYQTTESSSASSISKKVFTKINRFVYLTFKIPDDSTTPDKTKEEVKENYTSKIYNDKCVEVDSITKYKQYPRANKIHFKYKNNKLKYLYIPFNMNIFSDYRSIKFNKNRILFEHRD